MQLTRALLAFAAVPPSQATLVAVTVYPGRALLLGVRHQRPALLDAAVHPSQALLAWYTRSRPCSTAAALLRLALIVVAAYFCAWPCSSPPLLLPHLAIIAASSLRRLALVVV